MNLKFPTALLALISVSCSPVAFSQTKTAEKRSAAKAAAPSTPTTKAAPVKAQTDSFSLPVNLYYCDQSLPYVFNKPGGGALTVYAGDLPGGTWTQKFDRALSGTQFDVKEFDPTKDSGTLDADIPAGTDAPIATGSVKIGDPGTPLLANADGEFSSDGSDVERLLIRTLYTPNPLHVACEPLYAMGQPYPTDEKQLAEPLATNPLGTKGKFTLDMAQYYLIDVVRWEKEGGQYLVGSDNWYLFNYSDDEGFKRQNFPVNLIRDLRSGFAPRVEPAEDNLRMLGSQKVLFLAIHLAPQAPGGKNSAQSMVETLALKGLARPALTDKAWFDDTEISYLIQASKVEPANMQDLAALIQTVVGSSTGGTGNTLIPLATSSAPPMAAPNPTPESELIANARTASQIPALVQGYLAASPDSGALSTHLNKFADAIAANQYKSGVNSEQAGAVREKLRAMATDRSVTDIKAAAGQAALEIARGQAKTQLSNLQTAATGMQSALTPGTTLALILKGQNVDNISSSAASISQSLPTQSAIDAATDQSTLSAITAQMQKDAQAAYSIQQQVNGALQAPDVYVTYQGKYGAGLLSNLAELPVTLSSTWKVKFDAASIKGTPPDLPMYSGGGNHDTSDAVPAAMEAAASKPPGSGRGAKTPPAKTAAAASTVCSLTLVKAGAKPAEDTKPQADCTSTQGPIQDEGLYYWDVTIGVPFAGYKDVSFSTVSAATSTTSKSITRENAYALFDYFPMKEDILRTPNLPLPHVVIGLPIAGKTFDKPFFGGGESINIAKSNIPLLASLFKSLPLTTRFFAGVVWDKEFPAAGSTTPAVHRVWRGQYGIEFSVGSVASKLKKKSAATAPAK